MRYLAVTIKVDTTQAKAAIEELTAAAQALKDSGNHIFLKGVHGVAFAGGLDSQFTELPGEPATGTDKHIGCLVIDILPSDLMLKCLAALRTFNNRTTDD